MGAHAEGAKKGAKVKEGSVVKVHYMLTVEGEVVDSSAGGDPMEVKVGSGQVIPGFEKAIIGMKVGEKKTFKVPPEEAYGNPDPEVIQVVSKADLPPDLEPEVGMVLFAQSPDGERFPARIAEIREDEVVMDFNHPLAGKTLEFEVEIVSID
ncbi:MAG: peptidylprolyl isomerase [Deltaproteobacteria bacterium]|nr:peptidylprolyl isomerase [Deltaproteobacteria bacterium]